ncbi:MAG TPA: S41 family peptidase [Thermoanaerobaculaceae bacterium]|nr:S41 family peptidase [Thermoanaerobaculaceae bacterium]HRS15418.1 S41 family peptidase [Thermoanaerobaculaceae bacterium]
MSARVRLAAVVTLGLALAVAAQAQTKMLRFPDIHGDRVVFSYAGDLWTVPSTGGTATRLTAHPGLELFARFSPDGRWIAFTGQYDGDEQVYVVPSTGGVPRQLTFYPARGPLPPRGGYDNLVYGWTPDGAAVLFRSMRDSDGIVDEGKLFTVPLAGGLPVALPMPTSGAGDFAPDGRRLVYSPLFRDFRTWKRYEGGWAQDLFIFDLATSQVEKIAHSKRTERDPMWLSDGIYFVSDRDGTLNLYRCDPTSKAVSQLTHSTTWDVRWASSDGKHQIVYEFDGELRVFDTARGVERALSILVPDDGVASRPSRLAVEKFIEDFELAPRGERALFVARGDVFTAPIEHGPTRNLTNSSNSHEKWARWSPDGSRIAFVSDRSGEDQLYIVAQDGSAPLEALTTTHVGMMYAPAWSPDGKRLAFGDKDGKVFVVTVADRKVVEVAEDARGEIQDYTFSPDGQWLAFSMSDRNGSRSLWIWGVADGVARRVTEEFWNETSPAWDPDGKFLYFLSDREFAPLISADWNYAITRTTGIFALTLQMDGPNPFPPRSDEVKLGEGKPGGSDAAAGQKKDDKGKDAAKPEVKPVRIDFEGIAGRVTRAPIAADNYDGLTATKGFLLYERSGSRFYGRESYARPTLRILDLGEREESTLAEGIDGFAVSADGSKVLVRSGGAYKLYDAKPKAKDPKTVSTRGLYVDRVPAQEWAQIFDETWRRYRDFFYAPNMHGYDWAALREQYRPWVKWVGHRSDLNYLLGEMVAELNVGHAYIQGGDFELPERPKVGLPGARFEVDPVSNRYRIARILAGHNQEESYRSPLTEVGVDVRVGDYVLAVDGRPLTGADNIYQLLRFKTDPVSLTVNSKPSLEGARKATYRPVFSEADLLYLGQVMANLEKVNALSGGRVGYLHIPDMGAPGIYEFIKWFYPQIRKEGLVVDVRSNGGGNVSQWIIERLDTTLLGTRFARKAEPGTYPNVVFHGHKVCLLNETSASDGDIFPHMFRQAGLGPLIGKRSWGGVVGISGRGPLIDGGQVFVPQRGTNAATGEWVIEGHGVEPDIEVDNDPASVIAGRDPQLERGVAEVLKAMAAQPMRLPTRPPDPVKTK